MSQSSFTPPPLSERIRRNSYIPFSERSGQLAFSLTNDYAFKAVMQRDESILRALLGSLLGLQPEDIRSAIITNPIQTGATISDKNTVLDIELLLNFEQIANLEMQIRDNGNWPERSLTYLCRAFDNLTSGNDYMKVLPAHHIGILNFSLSGQKKQFYSHFYMTNEKTHEHFTEKFCLSVLDLTQTAHATVHDKRQHLDLWAAAFTATTWEEFKMLAEKDPLYQKVAEAVYLVSSNRGLAEQIRRRDEAIAEQRRCQAEALRQQEEIERRQKEYERQQAEFERQQAEIKHQQAEFERQQAEFEHQQAENQILRREHAEKDAEIAILRAKLAKYEK